MIQVTVTVNLYHYTYAITYILYLLFQFYLIPESRQPSTYNQQQYFNSSAVRIIHPYPPPLVFLSVDGADHLTGRFPVDLDPAVHLFHVDAAQHVFLEVAHVEDELQKAGLVESVLGAQVHEQALIISPAIKLTATGIPFSARCRGTGALP